MKKAKQRYIEIIKVDNGYKANNSNGTWVFRTISQLLKWMAENM